ncbi:hypothetical protein PBY51_009734 [Eleginops maclovinus]|uniref:Uncharacterized protein n=1 Tax=Eleginops maclovinus TaxID=56733 RepID=A0AAN7XY15_ELEMC|nr:hypothetical protein PBY51_009734 [Eleginops maclovinus]
MAERMSEKAENVSHKSRTSRLSSSSAAVKARAAAQAAKVRAEFAVKEARLKVEKAEKEAELQLGKAKLEAELSALEQQKEAAAAEAQAEALEAAEYRENSVKSGSSSHEVLQEEIVTRTKEYVAAQTELHRASIPVSHPDQAHDAAMSEESYITWHPLSAIGPNEDDVHEQGEAPSRPPGHSKPLSQSAPHTGNQTIPNQDSGRPEVPKKAHFPQKPALNAMTPPYFPSYVPPTSRVAPETEHLARYLARRDLVSTSLYQFDDKPEN